MAKQTLRQKIATGIAVAGISLAAICGGCEDPQGNQALAALGNMSQASPYTSASDKVAGAGLSTIGNMGYQKNVAEAGKSQVNVNVNNANQPTASNPSIRYVTGQKMPPDGGIYTGPLKLMSDGLLYPHGHGVMTLPSGQRYEGEYKDGKCHGQGVMTMPDGNRYEGEWKDGKYDGQGVYTWPDGTLYEGEYKDGKQNGKGKFVYANGKRYEGELKDGKKNGQGVMTLPDGTRYEGEWKDDKPNGHGVRTWPDGTRYEGECKDEKRNGFGKMVYADGRTEEGVWRDDKFVGAQSQVSAGDNQKGQGDSSKFGFVNVTADDPTFEVFADGAFVGNSPAKLKLSEGPHIIEVRKEGFKDYKKEIRVADGSELNLRAVLEKQ